jgi:hypothetical protein
MSFDLQLQRSLLWARGGVGASVVETLHGAGARVVAMARSLPARSVEGMRYVAADLSTADG